MNFTRTFTLLLTVSLLTSCATRAPQKIEWVEEALLHDGQIIHVTRAIKTGLDVALIRLPETKGAARFYSIETYNPNTGETVSWDGDDSEILPILIDFDGAVAYLVVYISGFDNIKNKYGCEFPPYVFLRHEQGKNWIRVQQEYAPEFIKSANLTYGLSRYNKPEYIPNLAWMSEDERERIQKIPEKKRAGYQTVRNIKSHNLAKEREGYLFQIDIPRNSSDLKTKRKIFSEKRKFMPDRCKQFDDM